MTVKRNLASDQHQPVEQNLTLGDLNANVVPRQHPPSEAPSSLNDRWFPSLTRALVNLKALIREDLAGVLHEEGVVVALVRNF